jgi:leucine dehydrogenase
MKKFDYMEKYGYEQLIYMHDRNSGLKGMICIHNTTLGPALGGSRVWVYESEDDAVYDVMRLARGMTKKAACAGLNLGGGKAVLIGNSKELRKDTVRREAFWRAFGRYVESLNGRYITAEDVGSTPEDMLVVRSETPHVLGLPTTSGDPSPFTAYGVYKGIRAALKEVRGSSKLEGIRIAVSGVGHVGSALCAMLASEGAILTVADIDADSVAHVVERTGASFVDPEAIYDVECDVFAPCALGAVINDDTLGRLKAKIIAGAANNVLEDSQRHGTRLHELGFIYVPDYVINAGGLINVYQERIGYNKEASMAAIDLIYDRTREIIRESSQTQVPTYLVADRMAERRIEMMRAINSIHVGS